MPAWSGERRHAFLAVDLATCMIPPVGDVQRAGRIDGDPDGNENLAAKP
jgi:hypothetical protein